MYICSFNLAYTFLSCTVINESHTALLCGRPLLVVASEPGERLGELIGTDDSSDDSAILKSYC